MTFQVVTLGLLPSGTDGVAIAIASGNFRIAGFATNSLGAEQAVVWNGIAVEALPYLAGGSVASASCISRDGTVVGGVCSDSFGNQHAVKWTLTLGVWSITDLGVLPGDLTSAVQGISGDGTLLCGKSLPAGEGSSRACYWDGTIHALTSPSGNTFAQAFAFSDDGTVIAGLSVTPGDAQCATWSGAGFTTVTLLAQLAGGNSASLNVNAVNADGSIIAGQARAADTSENAVTWTAGTPTLLGAVSGGAVLATGTEPAGTYVVGRSGANRGVLWSSGVGEVLPAPVGFLASFADGVAPGAAFIVGAGINAGGHTLPLLWSPSTPAVLTMDNVVVTSLATESPCTVAQFTTPPGVPNAVGLRWSDTRGQTFGNAVPQALSTDPLSQLQWNRTGYARDRVFELFWSAAVKTALNGAFVDVEPWKS